MLSHRLKDETQHMHRAIDLSEIPILSKPMKKTDLVNALASLVSH